MNSRAARIDTGLGAGFLVSAVIHVTVFLLFVWGGDYFSARLPVQETYYVDIVNLPTAAPQAAAPQVAAEVKSVPPPVPPAGMIMPKKSSVKPDAKQPVKTVAKTGKTSSVKESAVAESAFEERLARLEKNSEARREEEVLARLKNKVKATAKQGAPTAGGAEAGSRYVDFVKSRLEDALKRTSSYKTRNPEVAVRLIIAADGRLINMKVERSSGDVTFEIAVRRAIELASEKFTPPPNNAVFENGFIFKPKGISNGTVR